MDWSNEDYVRVYTRDTPDDLELSWQALAVWHAMLRKFDRSGLIPVRNGWASIARVVRIPEDVVVGAGAELERDGRVVRTPRGILAPNFTEAQTARKSDKGRQKESRDRRRAEALESRDESQSQSEPAETTDARHTTSHDVTSESRDVTLCSATLCSADPLLRDTAANQEREDPAPSDPPLSLVPGSNSSTKPRRRSKREFQCSDDERSAATRVLAKLGERNGTKYTGCDAHVRLIVERMRDGPTEMDLRKVIAYCADEKGWEGDPKMRSYLTPETLFGPQTIHKYLDAARSWAEREYPNQTRTAS